MMFIDAADRCSVVMLIMKWVLYASAAAEHALTESYAMCDPRATRRTGYSARHPPLRPSTSQHKLSYSCGSVRRRSDVLLRPSHCACRYLYRCSGCLCTHLSCPPWVRPTRFMCPPWTGGGVVLVETCLVARMAHIVV